MMMSEEMALKLHRMMWSDMQKELGDNPSGEERVEYKERWITKHFPGAMVHASCFLCEFTQAPHSSSRQCKSCPIEWPNDSCTSSSVHYQEAPISKILALPARNKKLVGLAPGDVSNEEAALVRSYYQYREELLSKASGRPATTAIDDHVKAIQKKAYNSCRDGVIKPIAEASGLSEGCDVFSHIKVIQEKAVEEYFAKTPGAKLATMDVDRAFKQYADEQKAPIFRTLAEASGLSAGNESVKAHIFEIKSKTKINSRKDAIEEIFKSLSVFSGVSADIWAVGAHVDAIREKASNEKDMEILRKANMLLVDTLNKYKDALSKESDLDRNRPVDDHIREIVKSAIEAGVAEERDRIMEKIKEVLNP